MEMNSTVIEPHYPSNVSNLSEYSTETEDSNALEVSRIMILVIYPVIIIFGTVGNLLILFVMRKEPLKKTPICFYMSVLAVADTGKICLTCYINSTSV